MQTMISSALPRFEWFELSHTMLDIKKQIYKRIKHAFSASRVEHDDAWINNNLILHIKDNTPTERASAYSNRKAACEFCGQRHNMRDDVCDIKTDKYSKDGNTMEAASNITLEHLYNQIKNTRDLKLEVMINTDSKCFFKALASNYMAEANYNPQARTKSAITLEQCFKESQAEEMLSGAD